MWWDKFEIRLTNAFAIVDKDAGWQLNTDESKLHLLNKKVRADFLTNMKTAIEMQMSATPMTTIYSSALVNYRNTVNQIFHNESTVKINNRWIQARYSCGVRGGRGSLSHQGHGVRGGRRGWVRGPVRRNDDWEVTGLNGRTVRVHTDYRFENNQWFNIPEENCLQLAHMRRDYHSQKRQRTNASSRTKSQCQQQRKVQQTLSYYQPVPETIIEVPTPPPPR